VFDRLFFLRASWRRSPLNAPIFLIQLAAVLGYIVAIDRQIALSKLVWSAIQTLAFVILINTLTGRKRTALFTNFLIISTIILALIGLFGTDWNQVRFFDLPGLYRNFPKYISGFASSGVDPDPTSFNPRRVGAILAILLPISIATLISSPSRRVRIIAFFAVLIGSSVLLFTQSILAIIALLVALLLIACWWRPWLILPTIAAVIATCLVLITSPPEMLAIKLLDVNDPVGIAVILRIDMWRSAISMIGDRPFTGVGLDNYSVAQTNFYMGHLIGPEPHAHNLYLQTWADLGIIGVVGLVWLIIAFVITVMHGCRLAKSADVKIQLLGLLASVIVFLCFGIVDNVALGDRPSLILILILGLATAITLNQRDLDVNAGKLWQSFTNSWLVPAILLLLLTTFLALPNIRNSNIALLEVHRLVTAYRSGSVPSDEQLDDAISELEAIVSSDPNDPGNHSLLALLYSLRGNNLAAVSTLRMRITIDRSHPLNQYAPFEKWRIALIHEPTRPDLNELLHIYSVWATRYPKRAELYILKALVMEQIESWDEAKRQILQGQQANAEPSELLDFYFEQLRVK